MILKGSTITQQNVNECNTASLTISQLMWYNSVKFTKNCKTSDNDNMGAVRHNRDRESHFPIYASFLIHSHTRKRELMTSYIHMEFVYHIRDCFRFPQILLIQFVHITINIMLFSLQI